MKFKKGDIFYIKGNCQYSDCNDFDFHYELISPKRIKCIKVAFGHSTLGQEYNFNPNWECILIKRGEGANHPNTNLFK